VPGKKNGNNGNGNGNLKRTVQSNVFATLVDYNLLIQQQSQTRIFVFLSKDRWNTPYICESSTCTYNLPSSLWVASGFLHVYVSDNQTVLLETDLAITAITTCVIHDCFLCSETFDTAGCAPPVYKFAAIIVITFLVLLACFALPALFTLLRIIYLTLMIPLRICYRVGSKMSASDKMKKIKEYYTDVENRGVDTATETPTPGVIIRKPYDYTKFYKQPSNISYSTVVFLSLIVISSSCSQNLFMTFQNSVCTRTSDTSQTCTGTFNLAGTLRAIGDSVCFSANNSDGTLVAGEITLLEVLNMVSLETLYYTSDWSPHSQSVSKCASEGSCSVNIAGGCPLTSPADKMMGGLITDPFVNSYPGPNLCENGAGCAGSGCFYCTPSCVYWAWSIVPTGAVYTVARPSVSTLIPTVRFTINGVPTFITATGISGTNGNYKLTNVGSFTGDTTLFGSNNVVYAGPTAKYGSTSAKNSPTTFNIGDIQAATPVALATPSVNAFIFDHDIGSVVVSGRTATFTFTRSGIHETFPVLSSLPTMIGGNIWAYTNGTLQSPIQNPGALLFEVSTTSPVTFTQNVNLVCPVCGETIAASGCYSCDEGFRINITLSSTCLEGLVDLQVSDPDILLNTRALSLVSVAPTTYSVYGQTSKAINSFTLTVNANGGHCSKTVSFTAVQNITLRSDGTDTSTQANLSNTLAGLLTFSSEQPVWGSILIYVLMVIILVAIIVLTPIIFRRAKTLAISLKLGLKNIRAKKET
jgi:hypothetical protein